MRSRVFEFVRDSGYLFVISAIPGLERITQYWFGNDEFLRGHSVSFWTTYLLAAGAVILWFFARRGSQLTTRALLVPIFLAAVSLYTLARLVVDNELFNLKALVLFLAIFLVATKPPRFDIAKQASISLGLFVILAAALSFATNQPAISPSEFNPSALIRGRILPAFGVEERWEGPFGNVNYASAAGGFTVLLAPLSRGPLRWFMVASGVLMLLMAQGRAASVGLIAGLLILILWSRRMRATTLVRRFRMWIVTTAIGTFALLVALGDLSGSGRTYIWRDYLSIGASSPLFGVGNPGIGAYLQTHEAPLVQLGETWMRLPGFSHGHSIYVDQWARGGLIGLLLVLGVIMVIGFFAARRANEGAPFALSMIAFAAVSGAFETTVTWNYLTVLYAPVFAAWILSLEVRPGSMARENSAASPTEFFSDVQPNPRS